MTTLYHWTDELGKQSIQESGVIQPNGPLDLVWLTDIGHSASTSIAVDPTIKHWRFEVAPQQKFEKWLDAQKHYDIVTWLNYELADRARPQNWWISRTPVRVITSSD